MTSAANIIPAIMMIIGVSAFIGAFFGGFAIAGRNKDRKHYILRGILWGLLIYFGGSILLVGLLFGACILIAGGMRF